MQATTSVGSGCSSFVRKSWSRLPAAGSGGGDIEEAIKRIARFECPVLITGETGVGKDEVARAIHGAGPRRNKPLVTINCGSLVNSLAESQLFGHEKGAFTGAASASAGAFRTANGGTVFLDEIGEMPIDLQPRLLHVLQHHVVVPVGASREHPVDVQVIAATNRNLPAEIRRRAFREDLFHRLNAFELAIPPLRERAPEIPAFIAHFSAHFAAKYQLPLWRPSAELLARFLRHSWPGNIRQIAQTIQRVYVFHDFVDEVLREVFDPESNLVQPPTAGATRLSEAATLEPGPLEFNLAELRRRTVRRAMAHTGGHRAITARLLGVSPNTLTKLIAEACPAIPPRRPRLSRRGSGPEGEGRGPVRVAPG
ncbi:MAG: Transcriptional regulatory protein QseF [Planctomycetota bacterium]